MSVMASQITGVMIVYSTVCSGTDQRKHQGYVSLALLRGIHKWIPVMQKVFPYDDIIMNEFKSGYELVTHGAPFTNMV